MTGTGFMKCMPITLSALLGITPPILEMEIELVFVAKIACSGVLSARFWNILFFRLKSSLTASMTKSESYKTESQEVYAMRDFIRSTSA